MFKSAYILAELGLKLSELGFLGLIGLWDYIFLLTTPNSQLTTPNS